MNPYDKMRNALIEAKGWLVECLNEDNPPTIASIREAIDRIDAALSEPPRQCDFGTADEQMSRYCKFTDRYNPCSYKGYARCAEDCPIHIKLRQEGNGELQCQLEWAQMPYTP